MLHTTPVHSNRTKIKPPEGMYDEVDTPMDEPGAIGTARRGMPDRVESSRSLSSTTVSTMNSSSLDRSSPPDGNFVRLPPPPSSPLRSRRVSRSPNNGAYRATERASEREEWSYGTSRKSVGVVSPSTVPDEDDERKSSTSTVLTGANEPWDERDPSTAFRRTEFPVVRRSGDKAHTPRLDYEADIESETIDEDDDEVVVERRLTASYSKENAPNALTSCLGAPAKAIREKLNCEFYDEEEHLDDGELPRLKINGKAAAPGRIGGRLVNGQVTTVRPILPPSNAGLISPDDISRLRRDHDQDDDDEAPMDEMDSYMENSKRGVSSGCFGSESVENSTTEEMEENPIGEEIDEHELYGEEREETMGETLARMINDVCSDTGSKSVSEWGEGGPDERAASADSEKSSSVCEYTAQAVTQMDVCGNGASSAAVMTPDRGTKRGLSLDRANAAAARVAPLQQENTAIEVEYVEPEAGAEEEDDDEYEYYYEGLEDDDDTEDVTTTLSEERTIQSSPSSSSKSAGKKNSGSRIRNFLQLGHGGGVSVVTPDGEKTKPLDRPTKLQQKLAQTGPGGESTRGRSPLSKLTSSAFMQQDRSTSDRFFEATAEERISISPSSPRSAVMASTAPENSGEVFRPSPQGAPAPTDKSGVQETPASTQPSGGVGNAAMGTAAASLAAAITPIGAHVEDTSAASPPSIDRVLSSESLTSASSNWSSAKKNAYLSAMRRKAKDEFQKRKAANTTSPPPDSRLAEDSRVGLSSQSTSFGENGDSQQLLKTSGSGSVSSSGDADSEEYSSWSAAEKRKFLQLLSSGMSAEESARVVKNSRSAHTPDSRERRQVEEHGGGNNLKIRLGGMFANVGGRKDRGEKRHYCPIDETVLVDDLGNGTESPATATSAVVPKARPFRGAMEEDSGSATQSHSPRQDGEPQKDFMAGEANVSSTHKANSDEITNNSRSMLELGLDVPSGAEESRTDMIEQTVVPQGSSFDIESPPHQDLGESSGIKQSGNHYYDSIHRATDNDADDLTEAYSVAPSAASSSTRSTSRWPRKKFTFKRRGGGGEKPAFEALDKDLERREAEEKLSGENETRGVDLVVPDVQPSSAADDMAAAHETRVRSISEPRGTAATRPAKSSARNDTVSIPRKRNVSAPRPGRLLDVESNASSKKEGSDVSSSGGTSRLVRTLLRRSIGSRSATASPNTKWPKREKRDKSPRDSRERQSDSSGNIAEGKAGKPLKLHLLNGSRNANAEEEDLRQRGSDDAVVLSHDDGSTTQQPRQPNDDSDSQTERKAHAVESEQMKGLERLFYEGGERSPSLNDGEENGYFQVVVADAGQFHQNPDAGTAPERSDHGDCEEPVTNERSAGNGSSNSADRDLEPSSYLIEGEGGSFSYDGASLSYDDREDEEYDAMLQDHNDHPVSYSDNFYDLERLKSLLPSDSTEEDAQNYGVVGDRGTSSTIGYSEGHKLDTDGPGKYMNYDDYEGEVQAPYVGGSDSERVAQNEYIEDEGAGTLGNRVTQNEYIEDEGADTSASARENNHHEAVDGARHFPSDPGKDDLHPMEESDADEDEEFEEHSRHSIVRADPPGDIASSTSSDDESLAPDGSAGVDSDVRVPDAAVATGKHSPDAPEDVIRSIAGTSHAPKAPVDPDDDNGANSVRNNSPDGDNLTGEKRGVAVGVGGDYEILEAPASSAAADVIEPEAGSAGDKDLPLRHNEMREAHKVFVEAIDDNVLASAESEEVAQYMTHAIEDSEDPTQQPALAGASNEGSETSRVAFLAVARRDIQEDDEPICENTESMEGVNGSRSPVADSTQQPQSELENGFVEQKKDEDEDENVNVSAYRTEDEQQSFPPATPSGINVSIEKETGRTEVEGVSPGNYGVDLREVAVQQLDDRAPNESVDGQSVPNGQKSKSSVSRSARLYFLSSRAARSEKDISTPKRRTRSSVRGSFATRANAVESPRSTKRSIERNFSSRSRDLSQRNADVFDATDGVSSPVRSSSAKSSRKEIKPIGVRTRTRNAYDDSSVSSNSRRKSVGKARGESNETKSLGDYSSSSSALSAAMLMIRRMPTWKKVENEEPTGARYGGSQDKADTQDKKQDEIEGDHDASSGTGDTILISGDGTTSVENTTIETGSLPLPDEKTDNLTEGESLFDFKDDTTAAVSGGEDRHVAPFVPPSADIPGDGNSKTVSSLASSSTRRTLFEVDYSDNSTVSAMSVMTDAVSTKNAALPANPSSRALATVVAPHTPSSTGALAMVSAPQTLHVNRKRRPGAAQRRLIQAKEAKQAAANKRGGWVESIQAAAASTNHKWDPAIGWVGYTEPETIAGNDDFANARRIGSLSLAKKLHDREAKDQVYDIVAHEKRPEPTYVPFPVAWEKERKAMIAVTEKADPKRDEKRTDPSHLVLRETADKRSPPPSVAVDSSQSHEDITLSASEDPLIDVSDARSVLSDVHMLKRRRKYNSAKSSQQKRLIADGASKPTGWLQSMQAASTTVSGTDPKRRWDPVKGWQGVKAEELVDANAPETVDFGLVAGDDRTMASVKSEGHLPSKPFLAKEKGLTVSERISRVEKELAERASGTTSLNGNENETDVPELRNRDGVERQMVVPDGTSAEQDFDGSDGNGGSSLCSNIGGNTEPRTTTSTRDCVADTADKDVASNHDTRSLSQEDTRDGKDVDVEGASHASSIPEVQVVKTKCSEEDRGLFLESEKSENPLEAVASCDTSGSEGADDDSGGSQDVASEGKAQESSSDGIASLEIARNSAVSENVEAPNEDIQTDQEDTPIILVENAVKPSELRGKTAAATTIVSPKPLRSGDESNASGTLSEPNPKRRGEETNLQVQQDKVAFTGAGEPNETNERKAATQEAACSEEGEDVSEADADVVENSIEESQVSTAHSELASAMSNVKTEVSEFSELSTNENQVSEGEAVIALSSPPAENQDKIALSPKGAENQNEESDDAGGPALSEAGPKKSEQEDGDSPERCRVPRHPLPSDSSIQTSIAQGTTSSPPDSGSGRFSEETSLLYGEQVSFRTEGASAVSTPSVSSRARQWMEIIEARSKARSTDASSSSYPQSETVNDSTSDDLALVEPQKSPGVPREAKQAKKANQEWKAFLERKMLAEKASAAEKPDGGEALVHKVHWPGEPNTRTGEQEAAPMFVSAVDVDSVVMLKTTPPAKVEQIPDDDDTIFDLDDAETNEATKTSTEKDGTQRSGPAVSEKKVSSVRDRIAEEEARIRSRSSSAERTPSGPTRVRHSRSDRSNVDESKSLRSSESENGNSAFSSTRAQRGKSRGDLRKKRVESPLKGSPSRRRSRPDEVEEAGEDDDSDHVLYRGKGDKGGVDNFLSRLTACGPVLTSFENKQANPATEVPLAHLAFLRTNPPVSRSSVVGDRAGGPWEGGTKVANDPVPPMFCGRPDTIVEDDREDDQSTVASRQRRPSPRRPSPRRPSPRRSLTSTKSSSSSVVSGEIGERAAYFEAMAMKAAVGGKKAKKTPSTGGSSGAKERLQSSPSEAWQAYMARKAGSAATYISDSSTEVTSTLDTADKSAAEKVEEMMEMLSVNKKSPGSKSATAIDLDDEIDERKNRVEELIDDTVLATSSRPRSRGRAPKKKSESAKAAEDLAAARVEAMMMAMSSEKLDQGEI